MIQRLIALSLLLILAACGTNTNSESTPENSQVQSEATEVVYNLELDTRHSSPMNWGGMASFAYPSVWRLRDTSEGNLRGRVTIFDETGYSFSISVSNDPANTASIAETVLNRMNQSAPIETTERNGFTIYYTATRGGNGFAATTYIEGTVYGFVELVSTQAQNLEPMHEMAFAILTSIQLEDAE